MTIQTTLGELVNAVLPLQRLAQARLPVKVSYHLSKLCRLIGAEAKQFHELRDAIITELGAERPPTDEERAARGPAPVVEVTAENIPAFLARVRELEQLEVSLPLAPIALAALGDLEISAADITALMPLLEESEHAKESEAKP